MTKRERDLERIHLLMTMVAMERAAPAVEICERANEECSVDEGDARLDEIDALPLISPRGITSKLNAMSLTGLVSADYQGDEPLLWSITDAGRAKAEIQCEARETT